VVGSHVDYVEYFHDLIRRMQDEMHMATTYGIARRRRQQMIRRH